ncbi:MAG TPA: AraC family transcriptional regulator [Bacteroides reticulotermitis]|nr:AraC family transcriptional regulator [Bacteroides reticulotermitis]
MKYLQTPAALTQSPTKYGILSVKDFLAIASYEHTSQSQGGMLLEEHLLLFVLEGTNTLMHGKQKQVVQKNQMILLPKATAWKYHKVGDPNNNNVYDSMLFFLKDDFVKDFIKGYPIKALRTKEPVLTTVKPVKEHLQAYLHSIKPYFKEPTDRIDSGLVRLKMMELLYDLALTDENMLRQILQLKQSVKADLESIIEENYTDHLSMPELAYLSGRSLSTFKRDFASIYNTPPSQWIRTKRLEKAKELLSNTSLGVADVCYMVGFENATHFSRIFKKTFGYAPSRNER